MRTQAATAQSSKHRVSTQSKSEHYACERAADSLGSTRTWDYTHVAGNLSVPGTKPGNRITCAAHSFGLRVQLFALDTAGTCRRLPLALYDALNSPSINRKQPSGFGLVTDARNRCLDIAQM